MVQNESASIVREGPFGLNHEPVCSHVTSMPYQADGVNLQHTPSDRAVCMRCGFDLGKVICGDASVVFRGCPVGVSHTGVVSGSRLQPVRRDDVAHVAIVHGCAGVVLEARGAL